MTASWLASVGRLLTAFTIEFDNTAEHRMQHRTTIGTGTGRGPWLVSMAFWANFVAKVPDDGWPMADAAEWAAITNLAGFRRWGYVTLETASGEPATADDPDAVVRLSRGGRHARTVWTGLGHEIEERWRARFGAADIDDLHAALTRLTPEASTPAMPRVGMADGFRLPALVPTGPPGEGLAARLCAVLLDASRDFERVSSVSIVAAADLLPWLGIEWENVATMTERSGVSREAVAAYLGFLQRQSLSEREPDPVDRGQRVRLTPRGRERQQAAGQEVIELDSRWRESHGHADVDALAGLTADLFARHSADGTPALSGGLIPPESGWRSRGPYAKRTRAFLADPHRLPPQPVILHRGGFPDGS